MATARIERADAIQNRARILEAARDVFANRGMNAEVREIAERAGLGVGTLYRHFECREALLAALLKETKAEMVERVRTAVRTEWPEDALRAMVRTGAEVHERFGALTEALLSGKLDHLHGGHGEFTDLLGDLLRRGIREGVFRADLDVALTVRLLEAVFTSGALVTPAASAPRQPADAVVDFFLRGIAA